MTLGPLNRRRILVAEDEFLLASDLCELLTLAGAEVIGPAPSVDAASTLIAENRAIDAAVLDINLRGDAVFPVADALLARKVPFAFVTGYDNSVLPDRFADVPRVEKPATCTMIATSLEMLLLADSQPN